MADKKKKKLPELYFVFDDRKEVHADIANRAVMVKKGDQHDDIMKFVQNLGTVQDLKFNTIVKDVDVDAVKEAFEDEGYTVLQADKQDFQELQRELDKLMTIEGGESKNYPRGK